MCASQHDIISALKSAGTGLEKKIGPPVVWFLNDGRWMCTEKKKNGSAEKRKWTTQAAAVVRGRHQQTSALDMSETVCVKYSSVSITDSDTQRYRQKQLAEFATCRECGGEEED